MPLSTFCRLASFTLLVIAATSVGPLVTFAHGGPCDAVLLPQMEIKTASRDERFALVSLITRENYEEVKKAFGVDVIIEGIPIGANYDEFNANRSKSSEYKNFKYSSVEAHAMVRQSLTNDQLR